MQRNFLEDIGVDFDFYFNNDGNGYAVYNADTLRSLLGRG
ncbi:MAG: DUF72 domain-containing protein [Chloroflexaceae bacterium]|nr:DUF72 domain-containing protein [Chloroflexaceae bacterium]